MKNFLHDLNELEGRRLWGFLNIKREDAISSNPVSGELASRPVLRFSRQAACEGSGLIYLMSNTSLPFSL
jgi:hypothetical protein